MEKNKKVALLSSLVINVFVLSLCVVFGKLKFGALDDYFMARILEGAYGSDYNVHMVFVNVVYGYALLPLYYLFPKVCWYYIGEVFTVFISFSSIGYIAIRKMGLQWGPIFALILSACFAPDFYLVVQFTQCAAVLSAAGFLMLIYAIEVHKENACAHKVEIIILYIVGLILVVWGSAMRWDAFLMGLPFLACALFIRFGWCWKNKFKVCVVLLLSFICILGTQKFNDAHYSSQEYQTFKRFQPYRVMLGDASNYDMNAVDEDLEELGVSNQDYQRLRDWSFYDKENFSIKNLSVFTRTIRNHYTQNSIGYLLNLSVCELALLMQKPIGWAWVFACIILFLGSRKNSTYVWLSLFCMMYLIAVLIDMNRCVYRVETGILFYSTVMGISLFSAMPKKFLKISRILLALMVIALVPIFYETVKQTRDIKFGEIEDGSLNKKEKEYKDLTQYIENAPDSVLFLTSMSPFMRLAYYRSKPYESEPMGSWKKVVSLGYWTPYYPDVEHILQEKGVDNPIRDMVKSNVLVVGDDYASYLREHYYDSVSVKIIAEFGDVSVKKYSVEKRESVNE